MLFSFKVRFVRSVLVNSLLLHFLYIINQSQGSREITFITPKLYITISYITWFATFITLRSANTKHRLIGNKHQQETEYLHRMQTIVFV